MKKDLLTLGLFVLAAGAPTTAQPPSADLSAPVDSLPAGAILRPAEWGAGCGDLHLLRIAKIQSTVASVRPLIPVDWQVFQPQEENIFQRALPLEPNTTFQRSFRSFAILQNGTRADLPLAVLLSQTPQGAAYTPPTGSDRVRSALKSSFGWKSLGVGVILSAWRIALNSPKEWGGTWEGFGKRFGTRQAGVTMSNSFEAALGAIWGEDPRYLPSRRQGFWPRTGYALKTALLAHNRNGNLKPAYARYTGIVGSNFITNAWRPPSENNWDDALVRSGWGISGRMLSNLFNEFWR